MVRQSNLIQLNHGVRALHWMAKIVEVGASADTRPKLGYLRTQRGQNNQDTLTIYHRHDEWLLFCGGYAAREAIQLLSATQSGRTGGELLEKMKPTAGRRLAVDIPPILEKVMPPEPPKTLPALQIDTEQRARVTSI